MSGWQRLWEGNQCWGHSKRKQSNGFNKKRLCDLWGSNKLAVLITLAMQWMRSAAVQSVLTARCLMDVGRLALGSVQERDASLKASFQLQIPALIQLVSSEDTLIIGSRRADGVVNNLRIHWADGEVGLGGVLSEFISSWLLLRLLQMERSVSLLFTGDDCFTLDVSDLSYLLKSCQTMCWFQHRWKEMVCFFIYSSFLQLENEKYSDI